MKITERSLRDREDKPFPLHFDVRYTQMTEEFPACILIPPQIVGMVHQTHLVGLGIGYPLAGLKNGHGILSSAFHPTKVIAFALRRMMNLG